MPHNTGGLNNHQRFEILLQKVRNDYHRRCSVNQNCHSALRQLSADRIRSFGNPDTRKSDFELLSSR